MEVKEEKLQSSLSSSPPLAQAKTPERSSSRQTRKRSEGGCPGSPEPNCAICLEKLQNRSVTDSCLHKFCFTCLLEWSKVKAECPLCKSKFGSIIHNIRSDDDFEEYTIPMQAPESQPQGGGQLHERHNRRFMEELHMSLFGNGRFNFSLPSLPFHHGALQGGTSNGPAWRRRRGAASNEFRKSIYERNLWVDPQSLADITGRYRECSPDWFRNNPAQTHRLVPWLNRELSILLHRDFDRVSYVLNSVLELICTYSILSRDFHHSLEVHLGQRTAHFCHEFYHYARSVYDLVGYDSNAVHVQRQQLQTEPPTESDNENDVIFVDEVRSNGGGAFRGSHPEPVLDENTPTTSGGETSQGKPRLIVPVDSSDSSEEENIQIVDVVPPRSERAPELVLLSTDEDDGATAVGATTIVVSSGESDASVNSSSSQSNLPRRKSRKKRSRSRENQGLSSSSLSLGRKSQNLIRKKGKGPGKKSSRRLLVVENEDSPPDSGDGHPPNGSSTSSYPEEDSSSDKGHDVPLSKCKSYERRRKRKRKRKRRSGKAPPVVSSSSSSSESSQSLPKKSTHS